LDVPRCSRQHNVTAKEKEHIRLLSFSGFSLHSKIELLNSSTFQIFQSQNYILSYNMADSNPANFANLPKDQLREIAAKGGHASHGAIKEAEVSLFTFSVTLILLVLHNTYHSLPATETLTEPSPKDPSLQRS
jgi:hypothetical protein